MNRFEIVSLTLQQQIDSLESMLQLLRQEEECLRRRDVTALAEVTAKKHALVEELQQLEQRCRHSMAATLPPGEPCQPDSWVAQCADTSLQRLWGDMKQQAELCQRQNRINGQLLEGSQRFARQMLELLLGGAEGAAPKLYNARGEQGAIQSANSYARV